MAYAHTLEMSGAAALKKFDIRAFRGESAHIVAIIGKRDTGKSTLIRDLLRQKRGAADATIVTQSGEKAMYGAQTPGAAIFDTYDDFVAGGALSNLALTRTTAHSVLALDDCMYDTAWMRDEYMRAIFTNGRIWRLTTILALSFPLRISPVFSEALDYVFLFRETIAPNKRRIWELYTLGAFPSFGAFCSALEGATAAGYDALVIKNGSAQCDPRDRVFWYRAEPDSAEPGAAASMAPASPRRSFAAPGEKRKTAAYLAE